MRPHLSLAAALAFATAAGCRAEKPVPPPDAAAPDAAATPIIVAYTATDYAFAGPAEVSAGPAKFRLLNQGKEPHHLIVVRLEDGKTFDSLLAVLRKPGMPPRWVHPIGGPNGVSATLTSEADLVLTAGQYAVVCFVPTVDGVPHMAKGMIRPLTVTPSDRQAPEAPADIVMSLVDYEFKLSAPITAGARTIRVVNDASQLHEIGVARLAPGKTMDDLAAWELGGRKGEPPGQFIGGMAPLAPGDHAQFSMTFEPGTYGLFCFVPDAKDGKPHIAHGMLTTFTIS